ncbi:Crp/Fnr family transcriptional regulator [Luteococcus sanguinis]|uniref:Crp/Fnr family transcriptional regulator n=1 Tax=Luteococcus sanguinis TaxID=174038 RepID=A0ABW1X085_9ACTN
MRDLPVVQPVVHTCVRHVPVFARLPQDEQDAIGALARPLGVRAGDLVFHAGHRTARLFVVHHGALRVERTTAGGQRRLLQLAEAGSVVGEHAFLTGVRPDVEVQAVTDAEVCVLRHDDLAQLVSARPRIALALLRSVTGRLEDAERRLGLLALEVPQRVGTFLLDQPVEPGSDPGRATVRLPWPKRDVAAYLGTTPASFSRALQLLSRRGAIAVDGDLVHLLDVEALEG